MPWTDRRRPVAISRAMAMPSATAASWLSVRRMRSISASGTRTPGTSLAMNSAFRAESNGKIPAMTGSRADSIRFRTAFESAQVEDRPGDHELRAGLDLVVEPTEFFVHVRRGWIHRHADVERGRRADRLAADVAAVVETRDEVGQADRVDVEHRRGIRVVADAPGVAGDQQQVPQANRVRTQQIRLDAEQVAIATRVVQHRLDPGLLLDEHAPAPARSHALRIAARPGC